MFSDQSTTTTAHHAMCDMKHTACNTQCVPALENWNAPCV